MPRHGSPLGEALLRTSLSDSASELRDSFSEFVDTALHLEDQLVNAEEESPEPAPVQTKIWQRCPSREGAMVWGALGLLMAVSIYFTMTGDVGRLLEAVRNLGFVGGLVLILVYAICMVVLVPGTILNVGAGFLYKTFWGYVVTIVGCMLGAVLCFALGRGRVQRWVREKVADNGPVARLCKLMGASQLSQRETFTIVLVSRLPPVMPFALTNYALSITDVSFPVYFFGTLLGVTPACLLDAYIGSLCDDLATVLQGGDDPDGSESGDLETAKQFELVVGVILTIFATTVLVVYGNRVYVRLQLEAEKDGSRQGAPDSVHREEGQFRANHAVQGPGVVPAGNSRPASPMRAPHSQDSQSNTFANGDVAFLPADTGAAAASAAVPGNASGRPGANAME